MKMSEARQTGNALESAMYSQELMLFMREKKMNPLKNMLVPIAQVSVAICKTLKKIEFSNKKILVEVFINGL